jgi:hypothetical protein
MEDIQKAFPFLVSTVFGYSLGLITTLVKSWIEGIKERAVVSKEATAAHKRLDMHEDRIHDMEKIIKDLVPSLVEHIKNKGM